MTAIHRPARTVLAIVAAVTLGLLTGGIATAADDEPIDCAAILAAGEHDTVYVGGPSGQLVNVHARLGDEAWESTVTRAIGVDIATLERLTKVPAPFTELTVVQADLPDGELGRLDAATACLLASDAMTTDGRPGVLFASLWFGPERVVDPWLSTALTEWAGRRISNTPCPDGTDDVSRLCRLVEDVERGIGPRRILTVVSAFAAGGPVYGASTSSQDGDRPGWRSWLDAVDELGYVKAGEPDLAVAERALIDAGVIGPADVAGRAAARTRYHAALDDAVALPDAVHVAMAEWRFTDAETLIDEAMAAG